MNNQTIYIVTPCFNSSETLDRTILSVVTQSGAFRIRYHVQDGGSSDQTVERLKWWLSQLSTRNFPIVCQGIKFSFASEPDSGMYDALVKGFESLRAPDNAFAGWINSDDVFMPGAFSYISALAQQFMPEQVSWVGGAASMMVEDRLDVCYDRHLPTEVIKEGLCDGTHWEFVQQEGTFFRTWLWEAVSAPTSIGSMKYAGDWNLWRLFAKQASYNQIGVPLAAFVRRANQLSALHREDYLKEINSIRSIEQRRSDLEQLADRGSVSRRRIKAAADGHLLQVSDETANQVLKERYEKVFQKKLGQPLVQPILRPIFHGCIAQETLSKKCDDVLPAVTVSTGLVGFDEAWQFPAITEQHAFQKMLELGLPVDGVTYVAFPWATLIDKLQTDAPDAEILLTQYRRFLQALPKGTRRVTVCQHIKLREFLFLFAEADIAYIFWSHTTDSDFAHASTSSIKLLPFPLYPVQVVDAGKLIRDHVRIYLFSFVGARANKYYLTKARDWILDELAEHPKGFIVGRDGWHYEKIVYQHQVRPDLASGNANDSLIEETASDEFRQSLLDSTFSLCPSGSGPNSIRLWESLGAGSIPVIISDTYLPPGDPALWRAAAVVCEETRASVAALPAVLEEIAADSERVEAMRLAGRQLWMLYGPDSFVYDIHKWMLDWSHSADAKSVEATPTESIVGHDPFIAGISVTCPESARYALRTIGSHLMLRKCQPADTASAIRTARTHLPATDPTFLHLEKVLSRLARQSEKKQSRTLPIIRKGLPKIHLLGRHSNRTPLSYAPMRKLAEHHFEFVERPDEADILMTGFNIDLRENAEVIRAVKKKNPHVKLAVISEEPLWDSLWSGGFTDKQRSIEIGGQKFGYSFLNHSNSSIFAFERIPYFLLTTDDFAPRYSALISRHLSKPPKELVEHWRRVPISFAFFGEYRDDPKYDVQFNGQAVIGLSGFRARVASDLNGERTFISGRGWKNDARRQDLPDWHLDKLANLDGQVKVLSGFENTHQINYISEKPFDAFAVGAVPVYYAAPEHRAMELISAAAILNVYGRSHQQAAEAISAFEPDLGTAEAWQSSASNLVAMFRNLRHMAEERRRVVDAIVKEISAILG